MRFLTQLPREIVTRLNREVGRIMQTAEVRATLAAIGGEAVTASPEEFAVRQRRERERFSAFIREANIRAQRSREEKCSLAPPAGLG